jgi:hypothetical protein
MIRGTRPPLQGDSLSGRLPRAEPHGLFCFSPSGDAKRPNRKGRCEQRPSKRVIQNFQITPKNLPCLAYVGEASPLCTVFKAEQIKTVYLPTPGALTKAGSKLPERE